jgi:protein SCO1
MIRLIIGAALLLMLGSPLYADLSPRALGAAEVAPKGDASLPLALQFLDETGRPHPLAEAINGRPAVLVFADYTCHTLCGTILTFAAAGLGQTGLRAGIDYRLIIIGLDPKDGLEDARAMKASRIGSDLADATIALTGDKPSIRAATEAVGYHYAYDAANDQFAHPAAAFVLDPAGRVVRALSTLGLGADDLRLALVDAGHGRIGSLGDHLRLLCYGFDPVRGIYTASILSVLAAAAGVTLACLAGAILWLSVARKRGAPS